MVTTTEAIERVRSRGRREHTDSTPDTRNRDFERAAALIGHRAEGSAWGRLRLLNPRFALAVGRFIGGLPAMDVALTDAPSGRRIRTRLTASALLVPRFRLCAAVYDVPAELPARPSGKRNQALRTALRAAEAAGVGVHPVPEAGDRQLLAKQAAELSPRLTEWAANAGLDVGEQWWVAVDVDNRPIGIAAVVIDRDWAWLVTLIGMHGTQLQSTARYVLHHELTRHLSEQGVRYLGVFDRTPLHSDAGAQHLQKILGYRIVRLRRPRRLSEPS